MSQSSKVMIDVEGGNNMMYLPLDRMIQRSTDQGVDSQTSATPSNSSRSSINANPRLRRDRQ
jgi:membrane protease subunit HflK